MKIRHKQSGVELEGEFDDVGRDFKELSTHVLSSSFYSKDHWEAVEPKWVDVTAECAPHCWNRILHNGKTIDGVTGYRLRKVKLCAGYCSTEQQAAFIIEQRQA